MRKQQPKLPQKPTSKFDRKSKDAALAQTKLNKAKERKRQLSQSQRVQLDTSQFHTNKLIEKINLASDSSQGSPVTIYTSDDPAAFMSTPAKKNSKNKEHVNRKIDKIINRIIKSSNKHQQENEQQLISITPADNTSPKVQLISISPAHQSTPVKPIHYITATSSREDP